VSAGGSASARRRIGFVLASDTFGGAEIHTLALATTLAERGHECVIAELNEPVIAAHRPDTAADLEVQALRLRDPAHPGFGEAYRAFRSLHADIGVFPKGWTAVGSAALDLACRLAFRGRFLTIEHLPPPARPPRVTGRHLGGLVPGLGLWWYAAGLRVYVRSLFPRRIVAISHAIAHGLVDDYGFPAAKVVTIRNGIDATRFTRDPALGAAARLRWGVPPEAVVYGAIGRLSNFHKGHDVAIELFARLCDANPGRDLWCVLVGAGPDEAALKEQARGTPWADRIVFPGPTERPWEACSAMDVFLMPSRFEGLGLALLEAMACGCYPVAMGVGGIREVVADASVGWLAPAADRDAFLLGMQTALDLGADGRAAVGARARQFVLDHFRAEVQYAELASLVERM
jgi:glycosyltransferase involved in cell wall biosynthesis